MNVPSGKAAARHFNPRPAAPGSPAAPAAPAAWSTAAAQPGMQPGAQPGPLPNPQYGPRPDATASATASTTGSWADSTRSVIWMTRGGRPRHPVAYDERHWGASCVSALVAAALTLIATSNLIDVYGSVIAWAPAALTSALIGALIGLAGVSSALRLWWQLVFLAAAQWVIGPILALNDTTIGHVVPTLSTLSRGWSATFGSFKYLISIEPPIGTGGGSLMAVWTIGLWIAFLTAALAVAEPRWAVLLCPLPQAVALVACALLGTSSGFHRIASGVAAALIVVIWMSWRMGLLELGRWISATIIVTLAAAIGIGGCMLIGQHRMTLRDMYDPPLSPYDYTSPLSGMRAYIKDHKDDTLVRVTDLPQGTPLRLAVMDSFDGSVWNLSDSREASGSSDYRRVGTRIQRSGDANSAIADRGGSSANRSGSSGSSASGTPISSRFTIDKGFSEYWLPLAGEATSVRFDDQSVTDRFYYNTDTDSAIVKDKVGGGVTYTEEGIIPATPTDRQIADADAAQVLQPQAKDVPDSVGKFATAAAGGQGHAGAAAQTLAAKLRDSGWFSHGLTGDFQSLPGHGSYRVNLLLAGTQMVGDSEQYASAMALMARELGLPSRVVLGFLPKDDEGGISDKRTVKQPDGSTLTEFKGNDIEAWVEIKLEGYGWVAFYPTPKETKIPDDNQDLTPPNPQTLVRQPPVPLTDPLRDEAQARGQSALAGTDAEGGNANDLAWARIRRIVITVLVWSSPLWIPLLIALMILLIKAIALARARRRGDAPQRVAAGWHAIHALARQSGIAATGTRREQAVAIARQLNIDAMPLITLGREADYAAFSAEPIDDAQAHDYWRDVMRARRAMLASQPRLRRIRTRLSLRNAFNGPILSHIRKRKGR